MKFIIDDTVVFDANNGTLSLVASSDRINVLPRPAVLLLEVLANNPGIIMSRYSLMEAAWLDAGLTLSGHNLNTYIKVIRHSLIELEVEKEIIRTLPRVGLMLMSSVTTEEVASNEGDDLLPQSEATPQDQLAHEKHPDEIKAAIQESHLSTASPRKMHVFPVYFLVIVVVCALVQYLWPVTQPLEFTPANDRLAKSSALAGCQIFTRENPGQLVLLKMEELLKLPDTVTACEKEPYYIFFSALKFENREKVTAVWCRFSAISHDVEECSTRSREYSNDQK